MPALVSVIVPTYDRLELLERAVGSVLSQTRPELELVVVDDGSTDGTAAWVRSHADARVSLVERRHGGNVAALRNAGVAASRGEYVAFLDSDDWWEPDKLEKQLGGAPFGWSFGAVWVEGRATPLAVDVVPGRLVRDVLTTEVGVHISTLVVARERLDSLGGFSERPGIREDWELAVRLALADPEPLVVPDVVAWVGEHPGRSTARVVDGYALTARSYGHVVRGGLPARYWSPAARRWLWHRWRSLRLSLGR